MRAAFVAAPLAAALVTLVLAWSTLLPGLGFWDTGEFQVVGPLLGTAHPTGYPSYVMLAWLASVVLQPLGEPAFRLNALAAILAALTAGLCAILVEELTGRPVLAVASGIVLGAAPVSWRLATHADPHGLHGAFVALLLVLLVGWELRRRDRWLVAAAAVFGLALGNHSLTLFLAPGIALFVLAVEPGIVRRRAVLGRCALVVLVAAGLVYLELPLRAGPFRAPLVYGDPQTLVGFLYVVSGAQFLGTVGSTTPVERIGDIVAAAQAQFGPLAALLPVAAVVATVRRPRYVLLTAPAVALTCWFAASYVNAQIERYYLGPAIIGVTWLALLADGAIDALATLRRAGTGRGPGDRGRALGAGLAVELVAALLVIGPTLAALPSRAAEVDRSDDRSAQDWLDETLATLRPDAVVVSWWDYSTALWYAQLIEGRRRDVSVIDDRTRLDEHLGEVTDVIDANLGRRPVYLIRLPSDMPALAERYRLEDVPTASTQPLVLVLGRRDGDPATGVAR